MSEKITKTLSEEFIINFMQEAQSHSGLPMVNEENKLYYMVLHLINCTDKLLDKLRDELLNKYMQFAHSHYRETKTWKSYDW